MNIYILKANPDPDPNPRIYPSTKSSSNPNPPIYVKIEYAGRARQVTQTMKPDCQQS